MEASVEQQLIAELEAALAQQQNVVNEGHAALQETIKELHAALTELESRESALTGTASTLNSQTADALKAVQTAMSQSADVGNAATKQLEEAQARIATLEEQAGNYDALTERLAAAEEQRDQARRELEDQRQLLIEAEKAHKRLRKMEQAYKDASEALQAGQAARRRAAELETTVEEYKNAAHAEQQRVAELQQSLAQAGEREASLKDHIASLEAQDIQHVADELAESQSKLGDATNSIELLRKELEGARNDLARAEKNSAELDEEVSVRGEALQQAEARFSALESKNEKLTAELEDVRMHARETAESERKLRGLIEKTDAHLQLSKKEAERANQLEERADALEKELQALRQAAARLETDLKNERAMGSKSHLATQLADALRDRETAQDEIRKLNDRIAELTDSKTGQTSTETPAAVDPFNTGCDDTAPGNLDLQDARRMLGEIFTNAGVITEDQLHEALERQKTDRPVRHLGEILVSLGYAREIEVAQVIARQRELEFISLSPESIDVDAARLIGKRLAEKHLCIPVSERDGELVLAMENPLDLIAIEDVERASERIVRPAVATASAIRSAIGFVHSKEKERV